MIRNLKWKADTGFNRNYWGMEEKGFRQPGSARPRPGAPEPGGVQALPGTYKVVVGLGNYADSTFITIKDDPRLGNRNDIKLAQRKLSERLRKSIDKLTTGMDRIIESEEILTKMQTQLRGLEGKESDTLRKSTTSMQDSLKSIREFISGKPSEAQGISRPPQVTVISKMQEANQIISAKMISPGVQEERMVENAELMIGNALLRINKFFDGPWKDYRKKVEETKVSLFKDYKPIE